MLNDSHVNSEILATLRVFLEIHPALLQVTGPIARYKIVIDANQAIGDLLHKYNNPHLPQTAIEEAVKSSAIELYAPTWLDQEMIESAIPQVSKRKKIPEAALHTLWAQYKEAIIWDDTFPVPADDESCSGDSKDVPYVALQQSIAAVAVLSRDKDIDQLGGKRVGLEFVLSVRSYARAASYAVGIRVGGIYIATISVGLLGQIIRAIAASVSRLPAGLKIALLAAIIFIAVHPPARERAITMLKNVGGGLAELWPEVEAIIELATEKGIEAEAAWGKTEELLG